MKKTLLFLFFLLFITINGQSVTDSTMVMIYGDQVPELYSEYDTYFCNVKKYERVRSFTKSDVLFPLKHVKCENSTRESNVIAVMFNKKLAYVEANEDYEYYVDGKVGNVNDFIKYYDSLSNEDKLKLEERAISLSEAAAFGKTRELIKYLEEYEKLGIGISIARPYEDYGMTGAKFRIFNTSKKTIKYITFTFYGKNPVEDKVGETLSRKGIGPVESYSYAEWTFDNAWLTDIVEYLKLLSVSIIYTDGTTKKISITDKYYIDEDKLDQLSEMLKE